MWPLDFFSNKKEEIPAIQDVSQNQNKLVRKQKGSSSFSEKDAKAFVDNQNEFQGNCAKAYETLLIKSDKMEKNFNNLLANKDKEAVDRQMFLAQQRELAEKRIFHERSLREEQMKMDKEHQDEYNRRREKDKEDEKLLRQQQNVAFEKYRNEEHETREKKRQAEEIRKKDENERLEASRKEREKKNKLLDQAYMSDREKLESKLKLRGRMREERELQEKKDAEERRMKHELEMKKFENTQNQLMTSIALFCICVFVFGSVIAFFLYNKN